MKKTLLTAVLSITLASLSACQTARVQKASSPYASGDSIPDRSIAQAEIAPLESLFKTLATQAGAADENTFNQEVFALVNANPGKFGLSSSTNITKMSQLEAAVGDGKQFLKSFTAADLKSLNLTRKGFNTAALDEYKNAGASGSVVSTMSVGDPIRSAGPVSEASFKDAIAAGADQNDVRAIVSHGQSINSKVGQTEIESGCTNLRSPASIHNLAEVVTETDAALPKGATQEQFDEEFQSDLAKVTGSDKDGAHERFCELADGTRCGVVKAGAQTCAE